MNDIEMRVGFENPLNGNPKDLNNFCSNSFKSDAYTFYHYSKFNIKSQIMVQYGITAITFLCWNGPYLGKFITIQKSSGPLDLFEVTIDPVPSKLFFPLLALIILLDNYRKMGYIRTPYFFSKIHAKYSYHLS